MLLHTLKRAFQITVHIGTGRQAEAAMPKNATSADAQGGPGCRHEGRAAGRSPDVYEIISGYIAHIESVCLTDAAQRYRSIGENSKDIENMAFI